MNKQTKLLFLRISAVVSMIITIALVYQVLEVGTNRNVVGLIGNYDRHGSNCSEYIFDNEENATYSFMINDKQILKSKIIGKKKSNNLVYFERETMINPVSYKNYSNVTLIKITRISEESFNCLTHIMKYVANGTVISSGYVSCGIEETYEGYGTFRICKDQLSIEREESVEYENSDKKATVYIDEDGTEYWDIGLVVPMKIQNDTRSMELIEYTFKPYVK